MSYSRSHPTRDQDEKILDWVKARASGKTCPEISKKLGVKCGSVTTMTKRILDADISESGECEAEIRRAYW